jgi:hypothetical protein
MIDSSYFKFCMCEKVGGLGGTPEIPPATVFFFLHLYLFSYCIF